MTLHLGHVVDGASQLKKIIDFLTGEHSQRLFRTKKRTLDLAVEVFCPISIILRTKLLLHDINAFWCSITVT